MLNEQFARRPDLIAKVRAAVEPQTVVANDPPLSWLISEYREKRFAFQRYSARSTKEIEFKLAAYDRLWGERRVQSITVLDIATFLNARSGHAQKKHRQLLSELFQFACHQGFRADNPAAATMEPIVPLKKRTRHSLEALEAILENAPDYLARAINLALHSLQRRGDLIRLQRIAVNVEQNTLQVLQEKTRNYPNPVFIEIDMHPELQEAVRACLASPIACPFLLHYRPKRLPPKQQQKKPHHFAMTEAFSQPRVCAGARRVRGLCPPGSRRASELPRPAGAGHQAGDGEVRQGVRDGARRPR